MVKLMFYGGVNEIGGNKILVEEKETRLLFDFGQSHSHLDSTRYLMPMSQAISPALS